MHLRPPPHAGLGRRPFPTPPGGTPPHTSGPLAPCRKQARHESPGSGGCCLTGSPGPGRAGPGQAACRKLSDHTPLIRAAAQSIAARASAQRARSCSAATSVRSASTAPAPIGLLQRQPHNPCDHGDRQKQAACEQRRKCGPPADPLGRALKRTHWVRFDGLKPKKTMKVCRQRLRRGVTPLWRLVQALEANCLDITGHLEIQAGRGHGLECDRPVSRFPPPFRRETAAAL